MRPRTKYAIIFGAIGFFLSYLIVILFFGAVGFLICGDGPCPQTYKIIENKTSGLIVNAAFIICWIFIMYFGYRFGKDKEKSLNNLG